MKRVFAIRGAITVNQNDENEILEATKEMLLNIMDVNNIEKKNLISMLFSLTGDLDAVFPAKAARLLGITEIALMCTNEVPVPNSLEKCIRVMVHCYLPEKTNIKHIYLREAKILRPDLMEK